MSELGHLFSPITIRNVKIRNRIYQSAHVTGYVKDGLPTERHVRYYEARARGGIGLIVQEGTTVSPRCQFHPEVFAQGWKDEIVPRLKQISEAVHAHGARLFLQLWHGGHFSSSYFTETPGVCASEIPSSVIGEVPEVLDAEGIRRTVEEHVALAVKAEEAGYDGVELNFCHGYLQQQFLSPLTNLRRDAYGGSLENRMRFGMEIIAAIRKAVGNDFVLGLRASADEFVAGGYSLDDMKVIMRVWTQSGHLDYVNATVATSKSGVYAVPPMMIPPRPFVYCAAEIKQVVDLPVFTGIRINDPVIANDIIKNHEADMVAMTRATLCDPELPNKAKEGRLDDIRLCIACNEGCWERFEHRQPITCMQNPEAGREGAFRIRAAAKPKKVIVIGGGCAGMEAAAVAKRRGHDVALYERAADLGGAILIPARVPSRQELLQAVRFLKREVERSGVEVHLNTEMTPDELLQINPDVVIIATGGTTIDNPAPEVVGPEAAIEIEPEAHVVTAEAVLEGKVQTGQRVVIADRQNYMKGLITAEFLADQGKDVTLVMPLAFRLLSKSPYEIDMITQGVQIANLKAKGVKRISDCEVKSARAGKVVIRDAFTEQEEELEADTLVLSYWRKAETKLYEALCGRVKQIYRIGDALAPRRVINAIYEGYNVGAEI